jgi:hypothetical protein
MSIFDLLGSAGAGYTKGLAQGEQAKIQLLRQQHQDKFNEQYKTDSLDLQRLRLKQDAERALKEGTDRTRDLYTKAAIAGLEFYRNPQNAADHDSTVTKAGGPSSFQMQQQFQDVLQKIASGEDLGKIKFPAPKLLDKISQVDAQKQLQGPEQGQPPVQAPPGRPPVLDFPGLAKQITPGYTHDPLIGALNFAGGALPAEALPPQQEPPTIVQRPNPAAGLVPQPPGTAATIGLKNQQRDTAASTQSYNEARTKSEELHQPNIVGLDTSLIEQRKASAKNLLSTASGTSQRISNDTQRVLDSIRKTDELIRNNKANNEATNRRIAVAEQANAVLADLRRMQTIKTGQEAADLEVKIRRMADSLPPDQAKIMNAVAAKLTVYDQLQGKWVPNPNIDQVIEDATTLLESLRKAPQPNAAAGATTGTGGAIQGAPSNASLSTQDRTQSVGPAGTNHTATNGNYKASWQVNRGGGAGAAKPLSPQEVETHAKDPELRKAVEGVFGNPGEMKRVRGTLSPQSRQLWDRVVQDMTKKPKAQKAKTPPTKPKTPAPNMLASPRR